MYEEIDGSLLERYREYRLLEWGFIWMDFWFVGGEDIVNIFFFSLWVL